MKRTAVELGIPYTGWPVRAGGDYEFGLDRLDSVLVEEILAWAREFNREFDEEFGWSSPDVREAHLLEGERLRRRVQEALGDAYTVMLDPLGSGRIPPEDD
ncbi:hypothetical protein J2Y69_002032 [Microbacterium resistens]|uniref:Uncharacterized protein n=1 Tax=Microbacterium resistens TaxID=156977 RepID=A0ABU1SCV2_9MICO|nr:hypothetical protein [Microbacterium resistens]MDR6867429.1 hypothetical protein [Microbacterium resistens]